MARTKKATTNPRSGLLIRRMILLDVLLLTTPRLNPNEVLCRALIHRSARKVNSANFVLTEFSEVRARLQKMAPCLWWKGMPHLGSGSGRRRPYVIPQVLDKKVSTHDVLRAGLRALVVALGPVRSRPLSPTHRGLRAFPRSDRGAADNPWQEWHCGVTAPDGALASRVTMVRGGPLAPCGDQPCRSSVQCPARRPGSVRGRVGWLDWPLLDVLPSPTRSRHRWSMGGTGMERLRPAAPASRPIGAICQPTPLGWHSRMAPAANDNRRDPLV